MAGSWEFLHTIIMVYPSHNLVSVPEIQQSVSYHLQRPLSKVPLSDQSLLVCDVESTLSQRLNDSVVAQQGFGSVALQNEAAGPAVEVCRQKEAGHRRLQVLLLILVCVEGVLQVCRDAVCMMDRRE